MSLNIGVFLGSKLGDDKKNFNLIKKFSKWFIKHNHTLIIGGTNSGLMQILAEELYKKVNVKLFILNSLLILQETMTFLPS